MKYILLYLGLLVSGCNTINPNSSSLPKTHSVSSFNECVAQGNIVMESYPRQCRDQSGQLFVEEVKLEGNSSPSFQPEQPGGVEGEGVFCTMDAKICPDGSSVGRVGPNCEFAPCP